MASSSKKDVLKLSTHLIIVTCIWSSQKNEVFVFKYYMCIVHMLCKCDILHCVSCTHVFWRWCWLTANWLACQIPKALQISWDCSRCWCTHIFPIQYHGLDWMEGWCMQMISCVYTRVIVSTDEAGKCGERCFWCGQEIVALPTTTSSFLQVSQQLFTFRLHIVWTIVFCGYYRTTHRLAE